MGRGRVISYMKNKYRISVDTVITGCVIYFDHLLYMKGILTLSRKTVKLFVL